MKIIENRIDQSVYTTSTEPVAELKSTLVNRLSAEYAGVAKRLVNQAVNEADALASLTSVPLLVLPTLAEEKVQALAAWSAHQRFLFSFSSVALAA